MKADREGCNKLRRRSRAKWLSSDKTCCLRKWQVHGPESGKKQVLKWKQLIRGQSSRVQSWSQPNKSKGVCPLCPAPPWPLTSIWLCPMMLHYTLRVYNSLWRSQRYLKPLIRIREFQNCPEWKNLTTRSFLIWSVLGVIISKSNSKKHNYNTQESFAKSSWTLLAPWGDESPIKSCCAAWAFPRGQRLGGGDLRSKMSTTRARRPSCSARHDLESSKLNM